jgi:predicted RND superfamily exporter protein
MFSNSSSTSRFFYRATAYPRVVLVVALIIIAIAAVGLSRLVKDTSVKAFIPSDHPALLADEKAERIFGLSDSIAVSITAPGGDVFAPRVLNYVAGLSEAIGQLSNVRADRVFSIATESSITGDDGAIEVTPYIETDAHGRTHSIDGHARLQSMPPHVDTLVSADASSTIIFAELEDSGDASQTYIDVLELVGGLESNDLVVHVAGPGAVSGFLGEYIDEDARKLQPLVFMLVLGFLYFAFRRAGALPGPLLVVVGAAVGSLGLMAWNDVPYYAITNALPVIIVAISVADAIHILSAYFHLRSQRPSAGTRDLVVHAMVAMARPISLTTITTIAGFVGIGVASIMPPITAFAWYAVAGVALAWLFSILVLPNMLVLMNLGPSPAFANWSRNRPGGLALFLAHVGAYSAARYVLILSVFAIVSVVAIFGAMQLRFDRSQVENFAPGEPIRVADEAINEAFAGTAFIDVLIETDVEEGLLDPARMQRIADLQGFLEQLPHVEKTVSIVDYLALLHAAVESRPATSGRMLPRADDSIAQYLLLYEMSGDPTDFEEEIDYDYQAALLRGILDTHYFSESRETVEQLQSYIETEFNDATLTATLAGDVTVGYHWMSRLERSHFFGVGLSLALVLATSIVVFRSLTAGLIAVVPVTFAVLVLYAVMGYSGIYLEPATSMFAAIALGVGVDFGIHLVEKLKLADAEHASNTAAAVDAALPPVARACFFNSAALALGFSVLMASNLPTLQRFGGLVTLAAVASYVAALAIVPALYALENAAFRQLRWPATGKVRAILVVSALVAGALAFSRVEAADSRALEVARNVADRSEAVAARRIVHITLTNKRGRKKERRAVLLSQKSPEARYTRITYTEPKGIRDTAFLSHDFVDAEKSDSGWFYMPSLRKVRRVPAADRGDYFLGTDFTYEDIQSELKFDLDDYDFEYRGGNEHGERILHRIAGRPRNAEIAKELGYGGFEAQVDALTWIPIEVEFFDVTQKPLKTVTVSAITQIDDIWTALHIIAVNHQTGHTTEFRFEEVEYVDQLERQLFQSPGLARGLPADLTRSQGDDS